MPFDLRIRPAIALKLHKEVYTSLASGDLPILSKLICSGLATKFKTIYTRRLANELPPQSWKLIRYTSPLRIPFSSTLFSVRIPFTSVVLRPSLIRWPLTSLLPGTQAKIMSDRVVPMPIGNHIYLRQCIVRIRSLQSLDKGDGNPPAVADLTEYLVMQQVKKEEDEPAVWKMWGTTKPLTRQEMETMVDARTVAAQSQGRITFMDRLKAMMPTRG
ncbi:hypothetical protein EPUS_07987 [Endocarpon pusillum Z07020]|uniref:Tim44-like domain-containing protein n=1 Tax=Endocarpon pusillum (strain Z07020 / HMAS-L-300199) TaxID=1263415 RepID=U1GGK6_ENDPU|nr:uncharacterized protein EPUS_07987 [Endocarpon pusillum Z07020]ERF76807.1 hypothetical protein EPUS_07987 [Endocarpon pusillum Z07020]